MPGRGTVVIGTLQRGIVMKNNEAELLGFDEKIKTSVGDIQVFKKSQKSVCLLRFFFFSQLANIY
jgi:elongation factor Tu